MEGQVNGGSLRQRGDLGHAQLSGTPGFPGWETWRWCAVLGSVRAHEKAAGRRVGCL